MDFQKDLLSIYEKSMLISEKRKFYEGEVTKKNEECLKKWKEQKNLVTDEILKLILEKENMSEKEFSFAISPIKVSEKYEQPEWLKILKDILDEFEIEVFEALPFLDISVVILPFILYMNNAILHFEWRDSHITLSECAIQNILNNYVLQILSFFEKCVVIELDDYKHNHGFSVDDKKEQFVEFLRTSFSSKKQYYCFYEKYAVSTRLATERSIYFLSNISEFFTNLINSADDIDKYLKIPVKKICNLELSVGDSHEKGKEVIIVKLDGGTIVYKPKNLDVCKAFSLFIDYLNNSLKGLYIKTPRGIYKENYAFIEYIEYKSCYTESEIKRFYERFGYLLALGFFLSITDLHLENIVAFGEYPIIVDGETMMQNTIKYYKTENAINRFYDKYYVNTILSTGLLPNTIKIDNSLDLSALSGDEQISHKKYLSPVNIGTSDFHFEETDYIMNAANNIPMLNEEKIEFTKYINCIIDGFNKVYIFFYNNKELLVSDTMSPLNVFKNKKTRFLVKSTQKYAEMLNYLNHPSCCIQMAVRERILQNIWAYPHYNKDIVKSEYKDLLINDIPIFYSYTDSSDLYDSYGNIYENYFDVTGYQKVCDRIKNIGKEQLQTQMDLLCLHLGLYDEYKKSEFSRRLYNFGTLSINCLTEAEKIGNRIISEAMEDSFHHIVWKHIDIGETSTVLGLTGVDLYDGISGIAVFFLELYRISEKQIYYDYYDKCLYHCSLILDYLPDQFSAYGSKFSVLLPIAIELKWFNSSKYENLFHKLLYILDGKSKMDIQTSKEFSIHWINGISGLLVVLAEIKEYIKCLSDKEKTILQRFIQNLKDMILVEIQNSTLISGQAHGYSGVMLALARCYKDSNPYEKKKMLNMIKSHLNRELELNVSEYRENRDKWCRGLCGMIMSRLEIVELIPEMDLHHELVTLVDKLIICQKDMFVGDSLCHGNSGTLFVISHLIEKGFDPEYKLQSILNRMINQMWGESLYNGYHLAGTRSVCNMSLFTGYAGVGLMYLKIYDQSICNVLTLFL